MKHFFKCFALLLFIHFGAVAQESNIQYSLGEETELPKGHSHIGFLGNKQDGYLQISQTFTKSMSLTKFSPSLKRISEQIIDLKKYTKQNEVIIADLVNLNGKYYWLYTSWNSSEKKEHLFLEEIDVVNAKLKGNPKDLISCDKVEGDLRAYIYNIHKVNKFKIHYSNDSSKIGVYVIYEAESSIDSKSKLKCGFWVFDNNFKPLWKTTSISMPYTEKKMEIRDTEIDNEGNFYFLSRVYNDDTRRKLVDNMPNSHFEILKFSKDSKSPIITPFQFEDKYISDVVLFQDSKSNLVFGGYYKGREKDGKLKLKGTSTVSALNYAKASLVDGSFFVKFNTTSNTLETIGKGFYEIPASVLKEYEKEGKQSKIEEKEAQGENVSAKNLFGHTVVFNKDGSLIMVGEEFYKIVTYGSKTTKTEYFYKDIIVQYIDPNGELLWTKKIPRNQLGLTSYSLGTRVFATDNGSYLFFVDNDKSLDIKPDETPASHWAGAGGILVAVKLDKSGNLTKTKILDFRENNIQFDIKKSLCIEPNMLIMRAEFDNIRQFRGSGAEFIDDSPSKVCVINIK